MVINILEIKIPFVTQDKILNKLSDIYLKKKLSSNEQKTSINKAILFFISEIDKVKETRAFHELPFLLNIFKKFAKKVNKDALRRVFEFFKNKYDHVEDIDLNAAQAITNLWNFMEKVCQEEKTAIKNEDES